MAFVPKTAGDWELFYPLKTASVATTVGQILDWPATPTGFVVAATSTTNKFAGVCQQAYGSGDATNAKVAVLRPIRPNAILIALTASALSTDVGLRCDLTDSNTVNRGANSVGRVIIDEFYSATSIGVHFLLPALTNAS